MTPLDLTQFEGHDAECRCTPSQRLSSNPADYCRGCQALFAVRGCAPALLAEVKRLRAALNFVRGCRSTCACHDIAREALAGGGE